MISWNLKRRSVLPIGLDIGHNSVKMIQLAADGEHIKVVAADRMRISPSIDEDAGDFREDVVSAVKQMLARGKFRGKDVVSCLPNEHVKITSLRIGETEYDQIEQALRKGTVQRFGLNPDVDATNYVVAGSVHQGDEIRNELILFAVDDDVIKDHISMIEECRLSPVAIDTVPCALFRGFERWHRREDDRDQTIVFVDMGSRSTTVVFGRGAEIIFIKQIPIGCHRFSEEIAEKLGVKVSEAKRLRERIRTEQSLSLSQSSEKGHAESESGLETSTRQAVIDAIGRVAEELAKEISLCLRYFTVTFRGKRVEHAVLSGGGAHESMLVNVLKRQLAVEIAVAEPLKGFDLSVERENINLAGDRRGLLCEWAVAVGLGLRNSSRASIGTGAWV